MSEPLNHPVDEASALVSLVEVKAHNIALLFANYLTSLDIIAKVVEADSGFIIYCEQAKLAQAQHEFEQFIKQPYAQKYQQAAWQSGEVVSVRNGEASLLDTFKQSFLAHAGMVTLSVFAICWAVFIASSVSPTWAQSLFKALQFYPQLSIDAFIAQPLRVLGPAFFHFSLLHIVFNTMWWWQLGGSIEKTLGKGTLINLLLLSAIVSNLGQYLVSGPNFGGLSGVVYALVGFVWWYGYLAPEKGLSLSKPIVGFLLFWLILGFVDLLPVNVANTAHLLGLLSGCFLAVFTVKVLKKDK
ncbi:rhomboid family intramembrane serine protease GlpG [Colwellia sp. D2M02]|uniref:Rhomboid family intramembrane serine protease GlpG n=1 Tax=Colwellia asteriadis TaxID=517723 RepID=A0ABN1L4B2_9GAMM|nr:rhomboid family intramembrane serine protease GlpG [Colwellia sp. D2M02]MBU2894613.1 rhomboid family intramembrane serine protease GlpG [Colwellia sp. D2M02]